MAVCKYDLILTRVVELWLKQVYFLEARWEQLCSIRSNVYFRRGGINTAAIIHEALHTLLGETDSQIQTRFGISTSSVSDNITQELRKHDCAE